VGSATYFGPSGELVFVDPEDVKQVLEVDTVPPE
jgi:hypothetical protein